MGINQWQTAVETLRLLRPDVYCKGSEYRKNQVDALSHMLPEVVEAEKLFHRVAAISAASVAPMPQAW